MITRFARRMLPKISHTEKVALESGTVSIDRNIFAGNMNLNRLNIYKKESLTDNERNTLSEAKKIANIIDEDQILKNSEMKPDHPFWDIAKKLKCLV